MPVYLINTYDITDLDLFKNYPPQVSPILLKYGAKVLAMDVNAKALEGAPKTMNAIIEFPSEEAVTTMYNDPDYQAIIHLRHDSTMNSSMIIVKQFVRPS